MTSALGVAPALGVGLGFDEETAKLSIQTAVMRRLHRKSMAFLAVRLGGSANRSAAQNALIAAIQAQRGRNPFWVPKGARELIKELLAASIIVHGTVAGEYARRIEDIISLVIQANIDGQRNRNGTAFTALSDTYKKWKDREYPGKPILEATGELRNAITVKFERVS